MKDAALKDGLRGDEIIAEVRAIREALAARFDYDLDLIFAHAREQEQATDRKKMEASPRWLNTSTSV